MKKKENDLQLYESVIYVKIMIPPSVYWNVTATIFIRKNCF